MARTKTSRGRVAIVLLCACAVVAGCAGHQATTGDGGKPGATPTPKPTPPPPKTTMVAVRADCSLDHGAPIELSRQGAERVHWALEGGMSKLDLKPKAEDDATKGKFARDLVIRCPGTAECWAQVTPNATVGDELEYRLVIDGRNCPDPLIVIKP